MDNLLKEIKRCRLCEPELPMGANPVLQASTEAKILIVGQAPGRLVHESGIPFNDPSGDRLRDWMGVDRNQFYDPSKLAIVPMAFCFPGTGKSGDLPPPPRCAEHWRDRVLKALPNIELMIILGRYAIDWHLSRMGNPFSEDIHKKTLTEIVGHWRDFNSDGSNMIPLPHPSPRNNLWLRRNPWMEAELIPELKNKVKVCL